MAFLLMVFITPSGMAQSPDPIQPFEPLPNQPDKKNTDAYQGVVEVEAFADMNAFALGETFHLVVRFQIRRDWQIFWQNVSDAKRIVKAKPTVINVEGPDGFEIGEVAYPGPESWSRPDDTRDFVYENETVLFVPVTAPESPDSLEGETATFVIDAEWWFRKRGESQIHHDEQQIEFEIDALADGQEPEPVEPDWLVEARDLLPKPLDDADDIRAAWVGSIVDASVVFDVLDADHLEFFPLPDQRSTASFESQAIEYTEDSSNARLRVRYLISARGGLLVPKCKGVLLVRRGEKSQYYAVEIVRHVRPGR